MNTKIEIENDSDMKMEVEFDDDTYSASCTYRTYHLFKNTIHMQFDTRHELEDLQRMIKAILERS